MSTRTLSRITLPALVLLAAVTFRGWSSPTGNGAVVSAAPAQSQEKGGQEEFGPYEPVANWPEWFPNHDGYTWGAIGALFAETPDRIWIAQRGELPLPADAKPGTIYGALNRRASGFYDPPSPPVRWEHVIFVVDRNGKMVQHWAQHDQLFSKRPGRGPHTMRMNPFDPEKHIWVIDDQGHAVFEFSYDGKLVRTIGEQGVPASDPQHFGGPTDIDWLPDGTFFISDGYINSRIAKYDKNGKFLMQWGSKGTGPSQFNNPHSVAVGPDRRVYVADRGNGRIQVFDENGKFIEMWPGFRQPQTLTIYGQKVWVSDMGTSKILSYDLNGKYLYGWGVAGPSQGNFAGVGAISADQENNLYVAELWNGRVQKFRPKPNADPAKLMVRSLRGPNK